MAPPPYLLGSNPWATAAVPHVPLSQLSHHIPEKTSTVTPIVLLKDVLKKASTRADSPCTPVTVSADIPRNGADPDMCHEDARLQSFEKWPVPFLRPETLARNGFYYLGRGDEVRCAFCRVEIMRWQVGDDPAKDHQRWAPQCPFLRKQGITNVPIEPMTVGLDECGTRAPPVTSVNMPGPVHPQYASEAARLCTFADWPKIMRPKPEDLAEAGFYYTGNRDKTKCFYCDGGLNNWESDDVPWEQHARWFDRCAYVRLVKGREYVQKVISGACEVPEDKATIDLDPSKDAKLCKICYAEERTVVFVPCRHVVACAKCAMSISKCPMCRRTFTTAVRLYYA